MTGKMPVLHFTFAKFANHKNLASTGINPVGSKNSTNSISYTDLIDPNKPGWD